MRTRVSFKKYIFFKYIKYNEEPGGKYYKCLKNIFYKQIETVTEQTVLLHNIINFLQKKLIRYLHFPNFKQEEKKYMEWSI